MRIVNFVQETGAATPAVVSVMKDSGLATILQASDVGAKASAEDKNMQINGLATVTVTNPDATHKAFITYKIVAE